MNARADTNQPAAQPELLAYLAEFVRGKIGEVVKDPVTAEKLKPKGYPTFACRPCLDNTYYETHDQPNVHPVDCLEEPILEITELANIVRISENDVDWYTDLIRHMLKNGLAAQDGYRNFTFESVKEALAA